MIIDTTQSEIERKMDEDLISRFTCTTHAFEADPDGAAWRELLCGFGNGLCNNYRGDFSEQSSEWTKGYKFGKKSRHKAFDELSETFLVNGKYLGGDGIIVDSTQTKTERDIIQAQEQLRRLHNNPNITIGCSCGKSICYGHAPKLRRSDCRHG